MYPPTTPPNFITRTFSPEEGIWNEEAPVPAEEGARPPVSEEEEEVWPPVWKPVEKSPQYHLIGVYFRFGVDDFADVYPPGAAGHDLIKRFFQQVRESRTGPALNNEELSSLVEAQIKFATAKINAEAEMHGEAYELQKLEKVVDVSQYRTFLLTFTIKEVVPNPNVVKTIQVMVFHAGDEGFQLQDWRFKPQEPQDWELAS